MGSGAPPRPSSQKLRGEAGPRHRGPGRRRRSHRLGPRASRKFGGTRRRRLRPPRRGRADPRRARGRCFPGPVPGRLHPEAPRIVGGGGWRYDEPMSSNLLAALVLAFFATESAEKPPESTPAPRHVVDASTGTRFDVTTRVGDTTYRCIGAGVRKVLFFKAYAAAFCIDQKRYDDV